MNNSWFEVKCKYKRQFEDSSFKNVTEPYLIGATSFTEAESIAFREVAEGIIGEFLITAIKRDNFNDIFKYEDAEDWYKCVINCSLIDDTSDKKSKVKNVFLVTANSVKQANERIQEVLSTTMITYETISISLTPIVEVIPYLTQEIKQEVV